MKILLFVLVGVVHALAAELIGINVTDPMWWVTLATALGFFVITTKNIEERGG